MQGVCHLSRRWHQQFCFSSSFAGHHNCLRLLQPVRHYRQPPRTRHARPAPSKSSFAQFKIREFEQQGQDASTRVPLNDYLESEGQHLRAELDKLDQELAVMREGPFGPNSEFMRTFPADEREELLKALEEEGVLPPENNDLITDEGLDDFPRDGRDTKRTPGSTTPLKVTLRIPFKDKIYIKRFNTALQEAQKQASDDKVYFALWKWYLKCQQHVSNFSIIIPEDVWHFLWKSQSTRYLRPKHLHMLGSDMIKAEVPLEDLEWAQYIDALQENGDIAAAAETWEAQKPRLGIKEDLAEAFWMTGVRIYVALGKPQKAQNLAFECYDHTTMFNPEILALVITAWAKSQSPSAATKVWSCYLELRRRLEASEDEQTTLSVLGKISGALLDAGSTSLALAVFKDMFMLTARSPTDSWRIFKEMVDKSQGSPSPSEDIVSQIGLSSLVFLPRTFQNKYFFASWIKWLLGEGKVDEAALVVELMYERGIKPDARHLNGLVAAWLRQGSPGARKNAESTAWAMVQSRVELIQKRRSVNDIEATRAERPVDAKPIPRFLRRGAPAATIETFSILLQHYTRRSDFEKARHLTDVMTGPAQIKPNSFIMNHWLYGALRSGQVLEVWSKYSALKHSIVPDLETFAALWDTAKACYVSPAVRNQNLFPEARPLFAEMEEWFHALEPVKKTAAEADFSPELYEQIIRCFCLSPDPQGTLCALYGLRDSFHVLPHEEITRLIIMSVARSFWADFVAPRLRTRGLRKMKNLHYQSAVKSLTEIVVAMMDKQLQEGDMEPEQVDDVESQPAQELRLSVLTSFLRMVMEKRSKGVGDVSQDISQTALEMKTSVPQ